MNQRRPLLIEALKLDIIFVWSYMRQWKCVTSVTNSQSQPNIIRFDPGSCTVGAVRWYLSGDIYHRGWVRTHSKLCALSLSLILFTPIISMCNRVQKHCSFVASCNSTNCRCGHHHGSVSTHYVQYGRQSYGNKGGKGKEDLNDQSHSRDTDGNQEICGAKLRPCRSVNKWRWPVKVPSLLSNHKHRCTT